MTHGMQNSKQYLNYICKLKSCSIKGVDAKTGWLAGDVLALKLVESLTVISKQCFDLSGLISAVRVTDIY